MRLSHSLFVLLSILLLSGKALANDEKIFPAGCVDVYKACNKEKFEAVWDYMEWWNAGKIDITFEQYDKNFTDKVFGILSCGEIKNACETASEANLSRYTDLSTKIEVDWSQSIPKEEGFDVKSVKELLEAAKSVTRLRSLLVSKNGKLVIERYFSRRNDPRPQHMQSVTKSISSILMGVAIDKNYIKSENETIDNYFPDYFLKNPNKGKQNITIKQLLTMTSGLGFVDNAAWSKYKNIKSGSDPGAWKAYWLTDNHPIYALSHDLVQTDDEQVFLYSTPACDLLTSIISKASGMSVKQFADKYLFGPLGISNYHWYRDASDNYYGGHGLFLRPRALAKIGQMMLDDGEFNGRQIVSQEWINKSFSVAMPKFVDMDEANQIIDYGYLWYLGNYKNYDYRFAWGYGGQMLFLIPSENVLVVTTAYPDPSSGYVHWNRSQKIVKEIMLRVIDAL